MRAEMREETRAEIATLHEHVSQLKEEVRERVAGDGNGEAVDGQLLRVGAAATELDAPPPRARHSVSTPNSSLLASSPIISLFNLRCQRPNSP